MKGGNIMKCINCGSHEIDSEGLCKNCGTVVRSYVKNPQVLE